MVSQEESEIENACSRAKTILIERYHESLKVAADRSEGQVLRSGGHLNLEHTGVFTLVTAILSNLVSNVPAVMLLKSLVSHFANPLSGWLTLAMASTLAGNLTITGSVANIMVVKRTRKEAAITFFDYFRIGLPITFLTLLFRWRWLSWVR